MSIYKALDNLGSDWPCGFDFTDTEFSVPGGFEIRYIDAGTTQAKQPALALICRAFSGERDTVLMFLAASDQAGEVWNTSDLQTVDSLVPALSSTEGNGSVSLMTFNNTDNGNLALAYWDASPNRLAFSRSQDVAGLTWDAPVTVTEEPGASYAFVNALVVGGLPFIVWSELNFSFGTRDRLMSCRANNAAGTSWAEPVEIESGGQCGRNCSVAARDNTVVIAYTENDSSGRSVLKAAHFTLP